QVYLFQFCARRCPLLLTHQFSSGAHCEIAGLEDDSSSVLLVDCCFIMSVWILEHNRLDCYCLGKLTVKPSRRGCSYRNCSGGHKCCQFDCGPVCVPPVSTKPGECPPQSSGRSCTRSCRSDSNCPNNKKCCSNGCRRNRTAPYSVKPGRCQNPKNIPLCAESCFHDGQCPATQKCCPTTTGHACSEPHACSTSCGAAQTDQRKLQLAVGVELTYR
uniref:WAP four-disulfide core domain 2 n=1 Tax=Sinocyclocheilus rhinocerous TaxID=307959 RepID=A0A673HYI3_9TELE